MLPMRAPLCVHRAVRSLSGLAAVFVSQAGPVQQFHQDLLTLRPSKLMRVHCYSHISMMLPDRLAPLRGSAAARPIAWIALAIVVVLTFVPAGMRPAPPFPHLLEHFSAFLLVGVAFGIGYSGQRLALALAALPVTAILELLQLLAPGRHARVIDFVANAAGACAGVAASFLIARARARLAANACACDARPQGRRPR
jgi:hypothetical protein